MKRTITITEENNTYEIKSDGFSSMEIIGLLRFYEKDYCLQLQKSIKSTVIGGGGGTVPPKP